MLDDLLQKSSLNNMPAKLPMTDSHAQELEKVLGIGKDSYAKRPEVKTTDNEFYFDRSCFPVSNEDLVVIKDGHQTHYAKQGTAADFLARHHLFVVGSMEIERHRGDSSVYERNENHEVLIISPKNRLEVVVESRGSWGLMDPYYKIGVGAPWDEGIDVDPKDIKEGLLKVLPREGGVSKYATIIHEASGRKIDEDILRKILAG